MEREFHEIPAGDFSVDENSGTWNSEGLILILPPKGWIPPNSRNSGMPELPRARIGTTNPRSSWELGKVTQKWDRAQNFSMGIQTFLGKWALQEFANWDQSLQSISFFFCGISRRGRGFDEASNAAWSSQNIPWNLRIILERATATRWKSFGKASPGTNQIGAFFKDHKLEKSPFFFQAEFVFLMLFPPSLFPKVLLGIREAELLLFLPKKDLELAALILWEKMVKMQTPFSCWFQIPHLKFLIKTSLFPKNAIFFPAWILLILATGKDKAPTIRFQLALIIFVRIVVNSIKNGIFNRDWETLEPGEGRENPG